MQHHLDEIVVDHLPKILEYSESLRSGLSRLSLTTLGEFIATFDITEKE
jgi:hypothetical protein